MPDTKKNTIPRDAQAIVGIMTHDPYEGNTNTEPYPYFAIRSAIQNNKWDVWNLNTDKIHESDSAILRNTECASLTDAIVSDTTITPYELSVIKNEVQNNDDFKLSHYRNYETVKTEFKDIKNDLPLEQPEDKIKSVIHGDISNGLNQISWNLDTNGTLTISGHGDIPDYRTDATISEKNLEAPWKNVLKDVHRIEIKDGITGIGKNAFSGVSFYRDTKNCDNITSVNIADSVKTIGAEAFSACHNLRDVIVPNAMDEIGDLAFKNCENLQHIYTEHPDEAYYGDRNNYWYAPPNAIEKIDENVFMGCEKLCMLLTEGTKIDPELVSILRDNNFICSDWFEINDYGQKSFNVKHPSCDNHQLNYLNVNEANLETISQKIDDVLSNDIVNPTQVGINNFINIINLNKHSIKSFDEIKEVLNDYEQYPKDMESLSNDLHNTLDREQGIEHMQEEDIADEFSDLQSELDDLRKEFGEKPERVSASIHTEKTVETADKKHSEVSL